MELTSVNCNSGQLFQHSYVVQVIFVQPREVRCFIASTDKKSIIRSERRTKLKHRNFESTLVTFALLKTRATLATTSTANDSGTKKQMQLFLPFCKSFLKIGYKHVAYELILGTSWPAQVE